MKKLSFILFSFLSYCLSAQLPQINLVQVGQGFTRPVDVKHCGDDRLFVVEKVGRIQIMSKSGVVNSTPFLDITSRVLSSGNEQGLLSLAFSPNFKQDGYFYVNYINGTGAGSTRISRFSVMATDSNQADPNSEVILLTFTQPYTNHNGASLQFGKDGYLYDSQGDGGSQNDPNGNGQNTNVYLAKILRFDVQNQATYAIPADNPFAGQANSKEEIWAYGVRNPWRTSFDRITGDLWIGDVGQNNYEEIDFQAYGDTGGHNYGWRCREGFHANPSVSCTVTGATDPVFEYTHSPHCSVTGGYIYRGVQYGKLWGRYLFTDYCSGQFWSIKRTGSNTFDPDTLQDLLNNQYTSFGEDNHGELYVTAENGRVYRMTETTDCTPVAFISMDDSVTMCAGEKLIALKGDTMAYEWYNSNGPIVGINGNEYEVPSSGWYKVRAIQLQNGCSAFSDSIFVTVNQPTALVPCNCNTGHCINGGNVSLANLFSPTGGTYTGIGVTNGILDPTTAGVGADTISYAYTNQYGCNSLEEVVVQLNDTTALMVMNPHPVFVRFCMDSLSLDSAVMPLGGIYSGPNVNNNKFNSAVDGDFDVVYTYTNSDGCVSIDTITVQATFCEAVNDLASALRLSISPNPNKGMFAVSFVTEKKGDAQLHLYDALGRVCWSKKVNLNTSPLTIDVDVRNLPKGMYSLVATMDGKNMSNKVIVE
ncbi:MAG: PQQ-dependent sugar dehydrogenase [Chitinophagales bacterium]